MKRSLIWIIPLAVVGLCAWLRWQDPAGVLEGLRFQVFDELQRQFPAVWEDTDVRVVDIDDESLARVGQWPWPRTRVAQLIDRLAEGGAAAIALDIVFSEPDRTSPAQIVPLWGSTPDLARIAAALPDHDAVLAETIARTPTVLGMPLIPGPGVRPPVIPAGFSVSSGAVDTNPAEFLMDFGGAVPNLAILEARARAQGSFTTDFARAQDNILRRIPLVEAIVHPGRPPQLVPGLATEALRIAQGAGSYIIRMSGGGGEHALGQQVGVNAVRIGAINVPTDRNGRMWLHDAGPVPQRFVPAWRVLAGEVPAEEIDGRIFFVGTSAPGLRDLRATPRNPAGAGVEIHARIAEQMLRGDFLIRPDWIDGAEVIWLGVFGALIILLLPRSGPIAAAIIGVIGVLTPFAFSAGAMVKLGWLVDPVYPAASVLLVYLVQSLLVFSAREAERRYVRGAFSRYLSPTVVETIAEHPELLKLGGEMRELSILFSDIRGFTTRSERMQAQELTQFLNSFLTPMTECILAEGGTIDKYMGDAVMAFWNAPLDEPDHPERIARTALAMVKRLAELNREWAAEAAAAGKDFEPLAIGIGINLGMACVGNMGSRQRFDYSIIGDAVNTASRLEGMSKTYGVQIVVGEALAARLPDFALVPLDVAKVRGKEHLVRIYTLLGDRTVAADPAVATLARSHAAILAALEEGNADAAAAALAEARAVGDARFAVTHALYAERLRALALGEVRQGVALAGH